MIALLVIGIAGYRLLEDLDLVDALYMTIITISTVGFGEVKPLSHAGRIFTVGLIVGGGSVAAYTLSGVAEFLLSGEWHEHWKEQRRQKMLEQLSDHVIICGYGRVGRHVAHEMEAEGLTFIVIDPDVNKVDHLRSTGRMALVGNAANEEHLKQAGIERARGIVVAASSDAENVYIVLTARSLRQDLFIIVRANYEESESKLLRAGSNRVILPYRMTGRRMVTMLVRPDVADFLDEVAHAGGLELILEQIRLLPASSLVGQTLAQAQIRNRLGVTILACKMPDEKLDTNPGTNTLLQANSQIIVLGTREQL